ncbi:MAG: phenylalanine--tRNA ligase subunit alpha [Thaumarchaeota archaeon]|nr:phenylalanine--tRNA ligase subunit alpha [Nitrososphaerota archaeon]
MLALKKGALYFDALVAETELKEDQIRRALQWLSSKKFVELVTETGDRVTSLVEETPELELVRRIQEAGGALPLEEAKRTFASSDEFSAAIGNARALGWVQIRTDGTVTRFVLGNLGDLELHQNLLARSFGKSVDIKSLGEKERALADRYVERGVMKKERSRLVWVKPTQLWKSSASGKNASTRDSGEPQKLMEKLTPEILASRSWKGLRLRPLDVEAKAPRFFPGRRHPVRDFINEVRETYISMGFTELDGSSVHPAFWNFDALFIPQDHPGREMQDTFYLEGLEDKKLRRSGVVANVASTHEDGWRTGSRGWRYHWRIEEARRLVLRTHNTVLTVKALSESKEKEARVFAVSKVYRNENLDYKHLAEFYQMDGIIVGEGLNVRHLMGFLQEFYKKLGMKDVKLWPTYFPYTEPSFEVVGYSDITKSWIELSGSGVFRPEVTLPLGVRVPVLAWGPGIERLMLMRYGLDDMRALYGGDLSWLRNRVEFASSQN